MACSHRSFWIACTLAVGVAAGSSHARVAFEGSEFVVNSYTTNRQFRPGITSSPDGAFIITWTSLNQEGPDTNAGSFGQRFDPTHQPLGTEFQVNTYTPGSQFYPRPSVTPNGEFIVTWTSFAQDGDGRGVFAQRFASDASLLGTEFQVAESTVNIQDQQQIATTSDGAFLVVWTGFIGNTDVYQRAFDADATPNTDETRINEFVSRLEHEPDAPRC